MLAAPNVGHFWAECSFCGTLFQESYEAVGRRNVDGADELDEGIDWREWGFDAEALKSLRVCEDCKEHEQGLHRDEYGEVEWDKESNEPKADGCEQCWRDGGNRT